MTDADKRTFDQAFNRLCLALRVKETDVNEKRVYFNALKAIEIEFLVEAAAGFEQTAKWFPKTGDWREAAIAVERRRREAQLDALKRLPVPICGLCEDTGWKLAPTLRYPSAVTQCGCRQTRRLELLGRRPMPLQLTGTIEMPTADPEAANKVRAMVQRLARGKGMYAPLTDEELAKHPDDPILAAELAERRRRRNHGETIAS